MLHRIPELGCTVSGWDGKLSKLMGLLIYPPNKRLGMEAITSITFQLTTEEAIYVEACLARRRELLSLADSAAHGNVFATCENATVEIARQYAQGLLTAAVTRRVSQAEKKGHRPASASVVRDGKAAESTNGPC